MADIAVDFEIKGKQARCEAHDVFQEAKKKHGQKLDFG